VIDEVVPGASEVAEAIDAMDEPEGWRAARREELSRICRGMDYTFTVERRGLSVDELLEKLAFAERQVRHLTHPRWMPLRPGRRMPSVRTIAKYWAGRSPFHEVDVEQPQCFRCLRLAPEWGGSYFERAHLVDRFLGGLDHAANLVPLCGRCHRMQPIFEIDQGLDALAWVSAGQSA
jgi:hypothetical protein